jgi:hypothetical protein
VRALFLFVLAAVLFPRDVRAGRIRVPVDIGVGPAAYYFFGPIVGNRGAVPHFGLKLNVYAVIDQSVIAANRASIPPQYQSMADRVSEVRISPSFFIPDSFIISPKLSAFDSTGIYGVTWRPLALGVPLIGGGKKKGAVRLGLSAGLLLTYAFIYSDLFPTTHFIRPGLDAMLELEVALSKSFLFSLGWASQIYVPQQLGQFGIGPLDQSIFHVGQAFLKLHFRFPITQNL